MDEVPLYTLDPTPHPSNDYPMYLHFTRVDWLYVCKVTWGTVCAVIFNSHLCVQ